MSQESMKVSHYFALRLLFVSGRSVTLYVTENGINGLHQKAVGEAQSVILYDIDGSVWSFNMKNIECLAAIPMTGPCKTCAEAHLSTIKNQTEDAMEAAKELGLPVSSIAGMETEAGPLDVDEGQQLAEEELPGEAPVNKKNTRH